MVEHLIVVHFCHRPSDAASTLVFDVLAAKTSHKLTQIPKTMMFPWTRWNLCHGFYNRNVARLVHEVEKWGQNHVKNTMALFSPPQKDGTKQNKTYLSQSEQIWTARRRWKAESGALLFLHSLYQRHGLFCLHADAAFAHKNGHVCRYSLIQKLHGLLACLQFEHMVWWLFLLLLLTSGSHRGQSDLTADCSLGFTFKASSATRVSFSLMQFSFMFWPVLFTLWCSFVCLCVVHLFRCLFSINSSVAFCLIGALGGCFFFKFLDCW